MTNQLTFSPSFQVLAYLPLLLLVGLYWLVPESVRWLLSHGRVEEAKQVIRRAARENNKQVPRHLMGDSDMEVIDLDNDKDNKDAASARVTVIDLFRTRVILFRTLNMCYQVQEKRERNMNWIIKDKRRLF